MRSAFAGYDSWLARPYEQAARESAAGEDYLGGRIVVGHNQFGLGRWGTIESCRVEVERDEDGQRYGTLVFTVEFSDGEYPHSAEIDEHEVRRQLG